MKTKIIRLNIYSGMGVFAVSAVLLLQSVPFMKIWFYCFAWWSCILIVDSVNYRRQGTSLLFKSIPGFLFMAAVSIPTWLIFELFNLRLKNWSYHALPAGLIVRWAGYAIAFATVIPALTEIAEFFQDFLKTRKWTLGRLAITPSLLNVSLGIGVLSLVLPLVWPRIFFPLVWIGFVFLLEPINYRCDRPSFVKYLAAGEGVIRLLSWAAAGLAAGFLWELFNFWAGSHWEYSIPYLNFGRIFQMPVFGYGGFVPFALEIFAIDSFLRSFYDQVRTTHIPRLLFWIGLSAFSLTCFYLMDKITLVR
jgi:hypothetical protein